MPFTPRLGAIKTACFARAQKLSATRAQGAVRAPPPALLPRPRAASLSADEDDLTVTRDPIAERAAKKLGSPAPVGRGFAPAGPTPSRSYYRAGHAASCARHGDKTAAFCVLPLPQSRPLPSPDFAAALCASTTPQPSRRPPLRAVPPLPTVPTSRRRSCVRSCVPGRHASCVPKAPTAPTTARQLWTSRMPGKM